MFSIHNFSDWYTSFGQKKHAEAFTTLYSQSSDTLGVNSTFYESFIYKGPIDPQFLIQGKLLEVGFMLKDHVELKFSKLNSVFMPQRAERR